MCWRTILIFASGILGGILGGNIFIDTRDNSTNLLTDSSSWSYNTPSWTMCINPYGIMATGTFGNNENANRYTSTAAYQRFNKGITVGNVIGKKYEFSVWVRTVTSCTINLQLLYNNYNTDYPQTSPTDYTAEFPFTITASTFVLSSDWRLITRNYTFNNELDKAVIIYIAHANESVDIYKPMLHLIN